MTLLPATIPKDIRCECHRCPTPRRRANDYRQREDTDAALTVFVVREARSPNDGATQA